MSLLFAGTVFLSAALLFVVEPLVGKLLLPLAGGTPAVWTTCMLFFQSALLAGYAYANFIASRLATRAQVVVHVLVVAVPLLFLPVAVSRADVARSAFPALALLPVLAAMVGLPFFALATTAPLMQRWFAGAKPGSDPYPLYAASNAGSLLALAAYPFLIEPRLSLSEQGRWWSVAYGAFVALVAAAGVMAWRGKDDSRTPPRSVATRDEPRWRWLLLSLAPSSLLLGTTAYLTTDITPMPLLWLAPLGLYLLTFIIAFGSNSALPRRVATGLLPVCALALFLAVLTGSTEPWWAILGIHLLTFFVASLACHCELARLKPPPERLTQFFLWMSLGGALGGVLNALIAPFLFTKLGLAEYPLALALAVSLMPPRPRAKALEGLPEPTGVGTLAYPMFVGAVAAGLVLYGRMAGWSGPVLGGMLFGVPLVLVYPLVDRPPRLAAGLIFIWLAGFLYTGEGGRRLFFERNFYGTVKVSAEPVTDAHRLVHGSTVHGRQFWKDGRGVDEPLSYYGRPGPAGDVFIGLGPRLKSVAVCGLGAGSLAAYAQPGQAWTFYEIDPAMVRIADDPTLFTYLADARRRGADVILPPTGDARLELTAPPGGFDVIALDAFSSDAIPVHLLTRDAVEEYLAELAPGGVLLFHVSNRYLDLEPVLAAVARDLKLVGRKRYDEVEDAVSRETGRTSSIWIALARSDADLGPVATSPAWEAITARPGFRTWTDDYSNILSVFKW
jgi:SAM-dependent methyltransferase